MIQRRRCTRSSSMSSRSQHCSSLFRQPHAATSKTRRVHCSRFGPLHHAYQPLTTLAANSEANLQAAAQVIIAQIHTRVADVPTHARSFLVVAWYGRGTLVTAGSSVRYSDDCTTIQLAAVRARKLSPADTCFPRLTSLHSSFLYNAHRTSISYSTCLPPTGCSDKSSFYNGRQEPS